MGKTIQKFISAIYEFYWDNFFVDDNKSTFRSKVRSKFNPQVAKPQVSTKGKKIIKPTFVSTFSSPILAKLQKEVNEILKYFKKNDKSTIKKSYAQAFSSKQVTTAFISSITIDVLKLKETFPNLPNKKIDMVQKVINGSSKKSKPKINMTTKGPFQKQVIMLINSELSKKFIKDSNMHVININHALKNICSNTIADFICADDKGVVIMTNNISSNADLQEIKKYVKNSLLFNTDSISLPRLSQSKSYFKIVGISYNVNNSNIRISSNDVKHILKGSHIFNDIVLASKPRIIKVSPKSDIVIIWIDIWDTQSGTNAKKIINRHFNIGSIIATVRGANMNPGVSQCKNCWKWSYMAEVCHIQGSKCAKCNGPHLTEYYQLFAWCCKTNNKINPPRLETKKSEPCPHLFKCLNCKGTHLADSNECPFWKHHFNKEQYTKEHTKLWETRRNSIHSNVNSNEI